MTVFQAPINSNATLNELLCQLSRQLPSHPRLPMDPFKRHRPVEAWLIKNSLMGVGVNTGPAPPDLMEPGHEERAYQLVTFVIKSLELLSTFAVKDPMACRAYEGTKQVLLFSIYPAMATRTQQIWKSPFAILASYKKENGLPYVDMGADPGKQFECKEFKTWYDQLKEMGEVGTVLDIVCNLIEKDILSLIRVPKANGKL